MTSHATTESVDKMDRTSVDLFYFSCQKFVRPDGKEYRYHQECRMRVFSRSIVEGQSQYIEYDGIFVVLSSLPSAKEKTVVLIDFTANYGYHRTDSAEVNALEGSLITAIKKLYKPVIRIITHPNWFDIRGGVRVGGASNTWFAKRFKLPRAAITHHAIIQMGDASM
jgi:hypothetical protein